MGLETVSMLLVLFLSVCLVASSKLPLPETEDNSEEHHHHQDHDEIVDRARTVTVGIQNYDNLTPIIVDAPPQGVDFSGCAPDETNQYCCVDFVGEIRSAVANPVLECVTREETVCHTSYVTQYSPLKEDVCEEVYEKKCHINSTEISINETVTICKRPLQRVCKEDGVVELSKRDTLQQHIKSLARALTNPSKPHSRDPEASVRSLLDNEVDDNDDECKIYYETICSSNDDKASCEQIPVRLCAEGCNIQEGEMECERNINPITRKIPQEQCDIIPRTVCKKITKLVPTLIEKEYCQKNPTEVCQLKFNKGKSSPSLHPIVQKYCIAMENNDATTAATTQVPEITQEETTQQLDEDTTTIVTTTEKVLEKQSRKIDAVVHPKLDPTSKLNQNVLNNYDNYKNHILSSYQAPEENGQENLIAIKPISLKTTTEIPTEYPDYETTKIDGFTIPKMKTTTQQPEVLKESITETMNYISDTIENITETVKKIVEEEKVMIETSETFKETTILPPLATTLEEEILTTNEDSSTETTNIPTTTTTTLPPRTPKSKLSSKYPLTQSHFNIVRTIPSLLFKPRFTNN